MNIESRIEHLHVKHQDIESIISSEQIRPNPDTVKISELKKRKLRLKEEMMKLESL